MCMKRGRKGEGELHLETFFIVSLAPPLLDTMLEWPTSRIVSPFSFASQKWRGGGIRRRTKYKIFDKAIAIGRCSRGNVSCVEIPQRLYFLGMKRKRKRRRLKQNITSQETCFKKKEGKESGLGVHTHTQSGS